MAEVLVSIVLQQVASILRQQEEPEVTLVMGFEKEVQKLTSSLEAIRAVLVDAEERQMKEAVVRVWLDRLKDISYDMDDALDELNTATLKLKIEGIPIPKKEVCFFLLSACLCFSRVQVDRRFAIKIKELNKRLDVIAIEKDRYSFYQKSSLNSPGRYKSSSLIDESSVHGRALDKDIIISQLLCETSQEEIGLHIISIVGLGGMGKTTLAQLAYNDVEVRAHFDFKVWVCVSDPFNLVMVAKAIIECIEGKSLTLFLMGSLLQRIHELILGKKFLLVLDDVWTENYTQWEPLKHSLYSGQKGSKILVTTRSERVARMMDSTYTHHLEELSKEECWSLFSQIAFFERSKMDCAELEEIGRKLVDKCKGLPLAAKTLGSLMRLKSSKEEWQVVLDNESWKLEVVERYLFAPLLLSYYDLPPAMKCCFSYCSIFPKDTMIERDNLVQLWMAQGYLRSRGTADMETIGREYFVNLAARSFFQDFEKDKDDGSIIRCKMHDIVHDLAQFLTANECFIMEVGNAEEQVVESSCRKARHLTLTLTNATKPPIPVSVYKEESLHTLLVFPECNSEITEALPILIKHLMFLRALNLSECSIKEVPREVGELIHLRYLNFSYNESLKGLPETICDLLNLQMLNLDGCESLEALPQGMGKLINLRHLKFFGTESLSVLPKGIGRLSSLRTLTKFIVSGGDDSEDACNIGDLKNLNYLRGHLYVDGLGNVIDGGEVKKAELKNKRYLLRLTLDFPRVEGAGGRRLDYDVLEALQPPSNLEHLEIHYFRGTVFPNWIMSLTSLRKLALWRCKNCECLPPLGKLPNLESLYMWAMNSVKNMGLDFLGVGMGGNAEGPAFPKLKELHFEGMDAWEEWHGITRMGNEEEDKIKIMPCLRSLEISNCPKLKALPENLLQTIQLKDLDIYGCPILEERCRKGKGDDWPKIAHILNITIDDRYVQKDGH